MQDEKWEKIKLWIFLPMASAFILFFGVVGCRMIHKAQHSYEKGK